MLPCVAGARLACYSPGWGLLALACRRTVALWDPRCSSPGPVASATAPADGAGHAPFLAPDGGCVHIDAGVDGHWSGHLLHLPPGPDEAIHLYDIRRLGRPAAERRERRRSPLPLVASISVARRHAGACFAAGADGLVAAAAGHDKKAGASVRWATARLQRRRRTEAGGGDEAAEEAAARAAKAKAKEEAAAKKKKRVVTKGGGMKMKQGSSGRTG
mmetsp:Transcript_43720/g.141911  ORF Transcript_43720/g.141911 Transcript_43720/m.141911 type:complete len:216 (+) Transcript_43720:547-1194(+)